VGKTLHLITGFPNSNQSQIVFIKDRLWPLIDSELDRDDYDFDIASRNVINGIHDVMDAFGYTEVQKSLVEHTLQDVMDEHFGDGGGNR
jgi:hypothetical protein